ncbi:MAG TPA: AI-2E family transporter [Nocardioides sp.]|uniref:AI-2E family transporter n=1 Tax=Nocardioides sp. TaxID=35761 RepID=UPI002F3EE668
MSNHADDAPQAAAEGSGERLTERLAHQWAHLRAEQRRTEGATIGAGSSNFSRAQVPWALDLAAAWAWRLIVIGIATYALFRGIVFFAELTIPVIVAILITALGSPLVGAMERVGIRRKAGAGIVVLGGLLLVAAMLALAGQQVASGANDLAAQVSSGLGDVKDWLKTGPLHLSDNQISDYIQKAQNNLADQAKSGKVLSQATHVGSALGHVLAGLFLVLFSSYFFLADGERIWAWVVRIAPRAARTRVDSSGRVAWISLTQFVRATVIVAITDAAGVMIAASILRVQFVFAIGVLVFLGAFVPIVGAFVAGTVAVLVAFVDHGIVIALIMLACVVAVQQIESHVLQPFLMGRFVAIHPLGIIVAIAAGILVAGIAGALVAVPFAAAANAVVQHLASETAVGEDPEGDVDQDEGHVGDLEDVEVADEFDRPEGELDHDGGADGSERADDAGSEEEND